VTQDPLSPRRETSILTLAVVTILVGIGAGLGGILLALLLHFIQHVAYGYSLNTLIGSESFLEGVSAAPPERRVVVLAICGVVAGLGWWAVARFGSGRISVRQAIDAEDPKMSLGASVANAVLQMATVALGSPLGREGAPRELSAAFAAWLSRRAGLAPSEVRTMIACAAGAGLAAIYNVPFGGALFALEGLLHTSAWPAVIPALATSVIATLVAWIGLGDEQQYKILQYDISSSLIFWSIAMGPVFGYAAYWFSWLTTAARVRAPRDWHLVPWCMSVFLVIGFVAVPFPQILGNGRGPTELGFDNDLTIGLAATLLLLKVIVVTASLRAGAEGGVLTPGLTVGTLLGTLLGGFWSLALPNVPLGAFAVIGAGAFLASSMRMPLTAIALIVEFTHVNHDFWIPIFFAVAGSIAMFHLSTRLHDIGAAHKFKKLASDVAAPLDLPPAH
jgi:H+/Cl- antiporter ClcA